MYGHAMTVTSFEFGGRGAFPLVDVSAARRSYSAGEGVATRHAVPVGSLPEGHGWGEGGEDDDVRVRTQARYRVSLLVSQFLKME